MSPDVSLYFRFQMSIVYVHNLIGICSSPKRGMKLPSVPSSGDQLGISKAGFCACLFKRLGSSSMTGGSVKPVSPGNISSSPVRPRTQRHHHSFHFSLTDLGWVSKGSSSRLGCTTSVVARFDRQAVTQTRLSKMKCQLSKNQQQSSFQNKMAVVPLFSALPESPIVEKWRRNFKMSYTKCNQHVNEDPNISELYT